jgi:imidazole glycerol-phosphate synthase subunit HisF
MLKPRVIPVLLIQDGGLVKTVNFKNPKYVGDPINAVRIFNEREADELIVLNIDATTTGNEPDYKKIAYLAAECRMPLCYGGGIRTLDQARRIIGLGVEKIAISSAALENPDLIAEISEEVGKQSVVAVLDVKKRLINKTYCVWTHNAGRNTKQSVFDVAMDLERLGVGEIVVNSIDNDGQMKGCDVYLAKELSKRVRTPLTIVGGVGSLEDIGEVVGACGVVGVGVGSFFVFKGTYRAVLLSYPDPEEKSKFVYSML